MAPLRSLSFALILCLSTTLIRLGNAAIAELCAICLTLLGWIDHHRLQRELAEVAIEEALQGWEPGEAPDANV